MSEHQDDTQGAAFHLSSALDELISQLPQPFSDYASEVKEFRISLADEGDRASALMAAAYLEECLAKLITAFMVDDKKIASQIMSHNGSMGTFSSKIDVAFMIGLISISVHRDMHILRKIRNDFAHIAKPMSFSDHKISSRCSEFHTSQLPPVGIPARSQFNRAMMVAALEISARTITTTHLVPRPSNDINNEGQKAFKRLLAGLKEQGINTEPFDKYAG